MKDKDMLNRMLTNGSNDGFIMLKDHKVNFKNNPKDSIGVHQRKYTSKGVEWLF